MLHYCFFFWINYNNICGICLIIHVIGVPGQDYPTYTEAPKTSFQCSSQQYPGYYADPEAQCQAFHICQRGNRQDSFVCPIGTLFNQEFLVCDWWYNVNCDRARDFYQVNEYITREMEEATMRLQNAARQGGYNYPNPGQQYLPPN